MKRRKFLLGAGLSFTVSGCTSPRTQSPSDCTSSDEGPTVNATRRSVNRSPSENVEIDGESATEIRPETPRPQLLEALSEPGTVVFKPGRHTIFDTIPIQSDNVTVVIEDGSRITIPGDASPTVFTGDKGSKSSFLFSSEGTSNVEILNRGSINANNRNRDLNSNTILFEDVTDSMILSKEGTFEDNNVPIVLTDCQQIYTDSIHCNKITDNGSVINPEGCENCLFHDTYSKGSQEVIDFNARNTDCTIVDVFGEDVSNEVVDINESPNTSIYGLRGKNCDKLLHISGHSGKRRTSKSPINHSNGVSVRQIVGEAVEEAVRTVGEVNDLTIEGMDVASTEGTPLVFTAHESGNLDGIALEGNVAARTDGAATLSMGRATTQNEGAQLDLQSTNDGHAAVIRNFDDVSGNVHVRSGGDVRAEESNGYTCDNWDLEVHYLCE